MTGNPDALVTLTVKPTEFEAEVLVAVLMSEGIEARSFAGHRVSMAFAGDLFGVPVKVFAADLERASEVLKQNRQDSVDIDWDEVDVGTPEQGQSLRETGDHEYDPNRMPWLARISFGVILGLIALVLISALVSWFL